jgi:hypothetical protein
MTKSRDEKIKDLNAEYVRYVLKSLDDDLAIQAVASAVSLKPEHFVKMLITLSDVTYFRNMQRDIKKYNPDTKEELTPAEIKKLLKTDGWLI